MKESYDKIFKEKISIEEAKKCVTEIMDYDRTQAHNQNDLYCKNKILHGKFYYEFIPTLKLAECKGATMLSLIKEDNLRYDAELHFADGSVIKIEWVSAIDHYEDSKRSEHERKYGYAPMDEKIETEGLKHNRDITETQLEAHEHREQQECLTQNTIILIKEVINKKIRKQSKEAVYKDMILGVVFFDLRLEDQSLQKVKEEISDYVKTQQNNFLDVVLVRTHSYCISTKSDHKIMLDFLI
jgi:hypothetical protein